jgi:hypothetical protein
VHYDPGLVTRLPAERFGTVSMPTSYVYDVSDCCVWEVNEDDGVSDRM